MHELFDGPKMVVGYPMYLGLHVPHAPIVRLRDEIQRERGVKLSHHGEAHVTVISALEMAALERFVPPHDARKVFSIIQWDVEHAIWTTPGIGEHDGVFFLVVDSPDLMAARMKLCMALMVGRVFDPERCALHVTIGWTGGNDRVLRGPRGVDTLCGLSLDVL